MPTAITVASLQKRIPLKPQPILRAAKTILRHEGIERAELSIVFVTDARIKFLNKKYLKHDYPTDVLAFDNLSFPNALVGNPKEIIIGPPTKTFGGDNISGEIIISADTALKNARIYHTTLQREMLLYVVHGILHLLGYEDHSDLSIRKMRRKEQALMNLILK